MTTPRLLITGARAYSALELARAAASLGWQVHMADCTPYPVSRASRAIKQFHHLPKPKPEAVAYVKALAEIINRQAITHLLPTCEETFYIARYNHLIPSTCKILASPFDLLHQLHHKGRFIEEVAANCSIHIPPSRLATGPEHLLLKKEDSRNLVYKPAYSRFASFTLVGPQEGELSRINPTRQNPWVVQQKITGREVCSYSILSGGKVLAHTLYHPLYRAGKGSGIYFQPQENPAILKFIETFAKFTNYEGQIGFDFIIDTQDKPYVLEANPRATSGAHLIANLPAGLANWLEGKPLPKPEFASPKMLSIPMYAYAAWPAFRQDQWQTFKRDMKRATEAVYTTADSAPWFFQFVSLAHIIVHSLRNRCSLITTATADTEWNGEALPDA